MGIMILAYTLFSAKFQVLEELPNTRKSEESASICKY